MPQHQHPSRRARQCPARTNRATRAQSNKVRANESGSKAQWLVVVLFETESLQQSQTLATALKAVLYDIHPLGALAGAERALLAVRRRARGPSRAAFAALEEIELSGFDPDAILVGREGDPKPAFSMERVS